MHASLSVSRPGRQQQIWERKKKEKENSPYSLFVPYYSVTCSSTTNIGVKKKTFLHKRFPPTLTCPSVLAAPCIRMRALYRRGWGRETGWRVSKIRGNYIVHTSMFSSNPIKGNRLLWVSSNFTWVPRGNLKLCYSPIFMLVFFVVLSLSFEN